MKIAYIATYPPRECGIGTFTSNKFAAVMNRKEGDEKHEGIVIAMNDPSNTYDYPEEVKFVIRHTEHNDYIEAAKFINASGADICILEHEYGIFGGDNGVYILSLLHELKVPVIAVLHTVLKAPSHGERTVLVEIAKRTAKLVVMSHKAIGFLTDIYGIPRKQIELIPHGVPDLHFAQEQCKREFGLENKTVLLTFGLISRKKGIETVIRALTPVVAKYPELVYIVLGKTHPAVIRHSGEEYRESLQQLVTELKLEDHVLFLNEFVDEQKLCKYLAAADIYVTPYLAEAQITSGTLSYAIGAGCAVISTPYWHAVELLDEGRGRIFNFNDHEQLSAIFMSLMDHPVAMERMRDRAATYGQEITWSKVADSYIKLGQNILEKRAWRQGKQKTILDILTLPHFSLDHIARMSDDTGIIQHAKYGIPDLKEGYCLDDNARALLMVLMANKQNSHPLASKLMPVYLQFIHYMQNDDGTFRNFMSFNRNFLDEKGSEDSFGRAIWALGYMLGNAPMDAYFESAKAIFLKASPNFKELVYPRAVANTIIGMSYYLKSFPGDLGMADQLSYLAGKLVADFASHSTDNWKWFEDKMTYDNAIFPLSLLHAYTILNDEKLLQVATESMHFLSETTMRNGYLSVVGNEGWYKKGGKLSVFAQQPVDAMMMTLLFEKAWKVTKDKSYLIKLFTSFMWFHGENVLRMSLYDDETKGCCDGLESYGINRNQGAESTLAYLIAHLVTLRVVEQTYSGGVEETKKNGTTVNGSVIKVGAA